MGAIRRPKEIEAEDDGVFDNFSAVVAHAQRAIDKAAKAAVAENDHLGIPTHSAEAGKLVVRQPPKAKTLDHP